MQLKKPRHPLQLRPPHRAFAHCVVSAVTAGAIAAHYICYLVFAPAIAAIPRSKGTLYNRIYLTTTVKGAFARSISGKRGVVAFAILQKQQQVP